MQFHPPFPCRKVCHDGWLRKAVGPKVLHVRGAVVFLVQMDEQPFRVNDILLGFTGIKALGFHPYYVEEVQDALRQEETEVVPVELELGVFFVHIRLIERRHPFL